MGKDYGETREAEAKAPARITDETVKILNEILNQVRAGLQPPPLSDKAKEAIALYNALRATLDHDAKRPATPVK